MNNIAEKITVKKLLENFEENFGRMLSPFEIEDIQKLVTEEGYSPELINEALRIAIGNGKYFVNYVSGVLRRMKSRGITTVQQLKASEREKQQTKNVELDADFYRFWIAALKLWADDSEEEIADCERKLAELNETGGSHG
ncbi:DnaD domain-containing protein [Streptococcus hillyeri]|uniref:DnaD domain-containing protein n=1 Tax=Streptococcus hillyeri TaxID=2282420 RepID=UPI0034E20AC0